MDNLYETRPTTATTVMGNNLAANGETIYVRLLTSCCGVLKAKPE